MNSLYREVAESFLSVSVPREPQPDLLDMAMATAKATDLMEGRPIRHGLKVAVLAGHLARAVGVTFREQCAVVYAGLFHDVGLAAVAPQMAPHLPESLGEKEIFFAHPLLNAGLMRIPSNLILGEPARQKLIQHPTAAAGFLEAISISKDVVALVAAHHEMWDGSGYPQGLSGDAIPIGARILALADTAEALMQEANGLAAKREAVLFFLDGPAQGRFDPDLIQPFRLLVSDDDFLRRLFTLEVETMLRPLVQERSTYLTGREMLSYARALSRLADDLLPEHTGQHASNVAQLACRMAEALRIEREQTGQLILAALLHDVGKLALPMRLLLKNTPLTQTDWALIHDHPRHTEDVLKGIPGFGLVTTWAGEHHERMNGSGYHGMRKGVDISVAGRMLALCDVFEAMTSPRPYRAHVFAPHEALEVISQGRYRLFDPKLFGVFRTLVAPQVSSFPAVSAEALV